METRIFSIAILLGFNVGVLGSISNNVTVEGLGTVIGGIDYTSWTNRTIYSFRSIPYAKAPIGDLRFRPPVAVTTWNGTLYATTAGKACPQGSTIYPSDPDDYTEDCLTMNVHVPEVESTVAALPVMIYIHGGQFGGGTAAKFTPNFLLEKDVILVVPQFRLGVFGLLCLQTDEVPGNVMFLDQIMAMQWVQDNIIYFGGDKDKVTIFGQSSGGATVSLHLFSPLSKGLFHQAIMHSGSAFALWVMDDNPVSTATDIATIMGCNITNTSVIATCMKNATIQELLESYDEYYLSKYLTVGQTNYGGNRAVIQQAGEFKFLTDDPRTMIKNGNFTQVPMMAGSTKHDGASIFNMIYSRLFEPLGLTDNSEFLEQNATSYILNYTGIRDTTGSIEHLMINTYFQNGELGDINKMVPGLTDICSVFNFKAGGYKMLQYNRYYNKSFLYTFNYYGSFLAVDSAGSSDPFDRQVNHGADLAYLFDLGNNLTGTDITVAKRMVQLWTSFAIDGVPSADDVESWPAMSTQTGPYLVIDDSATIGDDFSYEYSAATRQASSASQTVLFVSKPILLIFVTLRIM